MQAASEKAAADRARAEQAFSPLAERATARFMLAPLKPLSPEQLACATMQAVGLVDSQRAALEPQVLKDVESYARICRPKRGPRSKNACWKIDR